MTRFRIRKPDLGFACLEAIAVGEEIAALLPPGDRPSTVRIIHATADMIPILERHAERTFTKHGENAS